MKGIYTEHQMLAKDFYDLYPKEKFGLFLGLIKRRGKEWAYHQLSEIKNHRRDKDEIRPIAFLMKI